MRSELQSHVRLCNRESSDAATAEWWRLDAALGTRNPVSGRWSQMRNKCNRWLEFSQAVVRAVAHAHRDWVQMYNSVILCVHWALCQARTCSRMFNCLGGPGPARPIEIAVAMLLRVGDVSANGERGRAGRGRAVGGRRGGRKGGEWKVTVGALHGGCVMDLGTEQWRAGYCHIGPDAGRGLELGRRTRRGRHQKISNSAAVELEQIKRVEAGKLHSGRGGSVGSWPGIQAGGQPSAAASLGAALRRRVCSATSPRRRPARDMSVFTSSCSSWIVMPARTGQTVNARQWGSYRASIVQR